MLIGLVMSTKSQVSIKLIENDLGDTKTPFTMQSCSKPFTYAVCLNELGSETVHQYVGQEPSGRMFNNLCLDYSNKVTIIIFIIFIFIFIIIKSHTIRCSTVAPSCQLASYWPSSVPASRCPQNLTW